MNKYKELLEQRAANHAICEKIDAELEAMQPPEMWVCFFKKEHGNKPEARESEAEAKLVYPSLIEKIVRYVLPPEESA